MADEEKDITNELDEMIGMMDDGETAEPVDEPVEEEQVDEPEETESVEEPVEEGTVEEEETVVVEQPETDDVVDSGVVADEPDDEPVDEIAALREQNEALLAHIESLSGQVVGGVVQPPAAMEPVPKETAPESQAAVPQTPTEVMNFLENTSIDDLLEDPTKFNEVLNNVARTSAQSARQDAVQQVLRSVPELVMGYITRHSAMNRMVDDFYAENSDLANVKQTVAAVANDIHAKNPELGVEDVFKQSADRTRKLLGLKQQAQTAAKRKPAKPAFAKAGGARKTAPAVDPIQREINDLLSGDF